MRTTVSVSALIGALLTLAVLWLDGYRTTLNGTAGESFSPGTDAARAHQTYSTILEQLCVDGSADVTITDVRARYATEGVRIVDFAVGAPEVGRGIEPKNLTAYLDSSSFGVTGFGERRELNNRCAGNDDEILTSLPLVVTVSLGSRVPAYIAGVEVDYRVRGLSRTASFSNGVGFCTGEEAGDELDEEEDVMSELGIPADDDLTIYTCRP